MEWLTHIEDFLEQFPHTVSAFEALSTFLAVLMAVLLAAWANRQNRTRIEARVFIAVGQMLGVTMENPPRFVAVSILNPGAMPVSIPLGFFGWRLPFHGNYVRVAIPLDALPTSNPFALTNSYPAYITPRTRHRFHVSTPDQLKKDLSEEFKKHPFQARFLRRFIRFEIFTEDGLEFRAEIASDIKEMIASIDASVTKTKTPSETELSS
jgi:hypothetical protein